MRNQRRAPGVFALLAILCAAAPGSAAEPPHRLELGACNDPRMPPEARCGRGARHLLPRPYAAAGVRAAPVTVARENLAGLAGSYANEEMNLAVKVDLVEDRLRLSVTQGLPFAPALLVPTSPTRFRWEGEGLAPGLAVVFKVDGGKATALDVLQPGKPGPVVMKRSEPFALAKYGSFAALAVGGVLIGWKLLRVRPACSPDPGY
jgi:hypothetical protein